MPNTNFHLSPFSFLSRCLPSKSLARFNPPLNLQNAIQNVTTLDDALVLYEKMTRMSPIPSVIHFNQLLSRSVHLKDYSATICIFKDIHCLRIPVDDYTMGIVINCYSLSNWVDYGFSLLGWFFKLGFFPNEFIFIPLLKGLLREDRVREAQALFRKVVREGLCEINVSIYGTMVNWLCKGGNTQLAFDLLREMEESSCLRPDTYIYNMVIDGLCKDRMLGSALKVFDEMPGKCIKPSVVTYNTLICGYCREMKIQDAVDMFNEMRLRGLKHNVVSYNSLIQGLFSAGRCSAALELFRELKAVGLRPDVYTYCNMLKGLCRNGYVEEASLLLNELEQKGEHLHIIFYNMLMDGFCSAGKFHLARDVFYDLPSKKLKPDVVTCNIMIKGCCQNGLLGEAVFLLLKMEQVNLSPHRDTYNVVLRGILRVGEYKDAVRLITKMRVKGFGPDEPTSALLIDTLTKVDESTRAKLIRALPPGNWK